jgi:hypothetical protein
LGSLFLFSEHHHHFSISFSFLFSRLTERQVDSNLNGNE